MNLRMFDDPEEEALYHLLQPVATEMNEWGAAHDQQYFAVHRHQHEPVITVHRRRSPDLAGDTAVEQSYAGLVPTGIEVRFDSTPLTRAQKIAAQKVISAAFHEFCALDIHLLWWGVMDPPDPFEISCDETGRIPDLDEVRRVSGLGRDLIPDDLIRIKSSRRVSLAWQVPPGA